MYSDNYDRFGNGDDRLTGRRGNYRGRSHCRNSFLLSGFYLVPDCGKGISETGYYLMHTGENNGVQTANEWLCAPQKNLWESCLL